MKLKTLILTMESDKLIRGDATKLRGFFATKFNEYVLLHQHLKNHKFLYKYPYIQYKMIKNVPIILGVREGTDVLEEIYDKYHHINLNGHIYEILEKSINLKEEEFILSDKLLNYSFLTPWLALNEENYERYQRCEIWGKKKELLKKILIGNIISMSKGLGYTVPAPIKANIVKFKEVPTSLKRNPMLGFLGSFSVKFEIPDYLGLGKSVSRGFGTVKRAKE